MNHQSRDPFYLFDKAFDLALRFCRRLSKDRANELLENLRPEELGNDLKRWAILQVLRYLATET